MAIYYKGNEISTGSSGTAQRLEIVVDKNGKGDYTDLNAALTYAMTKSSSQPVTVLVNSGVYDITPTKLYGDLLVKGANRESTVVRSDAPGAIKYTFDMHGKTTLENLTVCTLMPESTGGAFYYGYAVHADESDMEYIVIRNCNLISFQTASIGAAIWPECVMIIENCLGINAGTLGRATVLHGNTDMGNGIAIIRNCTWYGVDGQLYTASLKQPFYWISNTFLAPSPTQTLTEYAGSHGNTIAAVENPSQFTDIADYYKNLT